MPCPYINKFLIHLKYQPTLDEILPEARILAAADAFDAMTTERPYRDPLSIEEALQEMETHAGTQFDADVVEVLSRIIHSMTSSGAGLMVG